MAVVLETERLVVRELQDLDLPTVETMLTDPLTMRFWPRPYTPEECVEWIERHRKRYTVDGCGYWLLSLKSGEPVGQVGVLRQEVDGERVWGLGYILHHPYWGNGYATEAASACLNWAFQDLETSRVVALIRPENLPSAAVARRLGMAIARRTVYYGFDHDIWSLSVSDSDLQSAPRAKTS